MENDAAVNSDFGDVDAMAGAFAVTSHKSVDSEKQANAAVDASKEVTKADEKEAADD